MTNKTIEIHTKCDICGKMHRLEDLICYPVTEYLVCPSCHEKKITVNDIQFTGFIKHISLNFTRFEFELTREGIGLYDEESGNEFFDFALIIDHKNSDQYIQVANSEDYWLHEDLTELFDLEMIVEVAECINWNKFHDHTSAYFEFLIKDMQGANEYNHD